MKLHFSTKSNHYWTFSWRLMLSTSLEWEYESASPLFAGRKLLRYWWWRDNPRPLSVCIRHLRLPTFSPTSSVCRIRLIAPVLRLVRLTYTHLCCSHTHLKYQFAFLSTPLQAQPRCKIISLTLTETLSLFFSVSISSAVIEGVIMHVAFIKQDLNLKLHFCHC